MQRAMDRFGRWSSAEICALVASWLGVNSLAQAVPIDLMDATPTVVGPTTLHIGGIATLGSSYWADFEWNETSNIFQVSAYEEEEPPEAPDGFVLIEPGMFTMGSPTDEPGRWDHETEHAVTLTRAFYLSETEVTQAQWLAVMGTNPSNRSDCDACPVEEVSWNDAVDYCNALSALEGLEPAYEVIGADVSWNQTANGYRLPTESEWEYACRAGSTTAFYNGPITDTNCDDPNLDQIGWYCGNAGQRTHEVGQKIANAWGLYDMSGNVSEWCWDWYDEYPVGPVTDPVGPADGARRVHRGGSYVYPAPYFRSAYRHYAYPDFFNYNYGFRSARSAP